MFRFGRRWQWPVNGSLRRFALVTLRAVGVLTTGRLANVFSALGARGDTEWFFEMGTGKPVFYLRDGQLNWVAGPKS